MDVVSLFVTYAKSAEFEQPTKDPLDDATMNSQPAPMFRVSLGDERLDAAPTQRHANFLFGIVGAIGECRVGAFAATAARTFDRWNRVDQRDRGLRIVDVRAGVRDRQRRSLAIADNMPLRAIFTAIGGIGAGLRPPKTLAPSNCRSLLSTNRSRRLAPVRRAAPARFFPTPRPLASRASAANKSCPIRSPVLGENTPKDNRCAARTRCRSVPAGWIPADGHPWAWRAPAATMVRFVPTILLPAAVSPSVFLREHRKANRTAHFAPIEVLLESLNNAIKYTPRRRVYLVDA